MLHRHSLSHVIFHDRPYFFARCRFQKRSFSLEIKNDDRKILLAAEAEGGLVENFQILFNGFLER